MHLDESVAIIIFSEDRERALFIKRRDIPVWVLPGGGIEVSETPLQAALREGEEETGYNLKCVRHVATYLPSNPLTRKTYLFECTIIGGNPTLGDETAAVQFFPIKHLPKLSPPPHEEWILDALDPAKPHFTGPIKTVTYPIIIKKLLRHPLLVLKFLFTRLFKRQTH